MSREWKEIIKGVFLVSGVYLIAIAAADPAFNWEAPVGGGIVGLYQFVSYYW